MRPRWILTFGVASVAGLVATGCDSGSAPTQPRAISASRPLLDGRDGDAHVVMGTNNPAIDVPAVQHAVDQGGEVVLKGHFSFAAPPTKPVASSLGLKLPAAEVLVSKAVTISGGEGDEMPTIDAGTISFYVEAPGAAVAIRGVRFVRPIFSAVLVSAVHGLEVAANRIEGLQPFAGNAQAISVITTFPIPSPTSPGNPQNIAGRLSIVHNYIDATGGKANVDNTLGVTVFSAGVSGAEVDFNVSGNTIKNTTEPAINFRRIVGRARIEHNVIATGTTIGAAAGNQAIRVVNIGTYVIAHNSITCEWATSDAEGIGVFSQFAAWPIEHAVATDNNITMAAPAGTGFTAFSAGIGVYGFANANVVRRNTIRGSARAGLSIPEFSRAGQPTPSPQDNAFIRNGFVHFRPSSPSAPANYFYVGSQAVRTLIVGATPSMVTDRGSRTTIEPIGTGR